jgi:hypothetical protein
MFLACVSCCLFAQGSYAQTQDLPPVSAMPSPNGMMPTIMASPPPVAASKPRAANTGLKSLPDAAAKDQEMQDTQKRSEKIRRLLDIQIKHSKEAEALMTTEQTLQDQRKKQLDAEDKQQEQYQKLLDKWQAQQEQYQKYLDSLTPVKQEPKK